MTLARQALGLHGEAIVCRELERRGYAVLARRYRTRLGELPCRFDVAAVAMGQGVPLITIFEDAFRPGW